MACSPAASVPTARARELLTLPIIPVDAIKATTNPDQPQTPEHRCPPLRRPHDDHRALRARLNSELSSKPANAGVQDRHLMIRSISSPSLNASRFCRRHSDECALARTNFLLVQQTTAPSSLLWLPTRQRKHLGMLRCAHPLQLSPCAGMHAAGSPLKSP
jgi:hypothetical protein